MMKLLTQLLIKNNLDKTQIPKLASYMFTAKVSEQFIKSSILLLRKKGETAEEIVHLVKFMRQHALKLNADLPYLVDFCGTGGDKKNTFNISTLSALVAAGGGAYVAKHGNRSASSHCGSSDLMEGLGINLNISPDKAFQILKRTHFVYLHAPNFHPIFGKVQKVRRELKTKTTFNFLGPLLNPAGANHQLIGVSEPSLLDIYPEVLRELGTRHAWVIMSDDGYDEISLTGEILAVQVYKGKIRRLTLTPKDFGLVKINPKELTTSNTKDNLTIARSVLSGKETGPRIDVVLANAALGLVASGRAFDLREGMALARYSLETGRAKQVLEQVIEFSQ